MRRVTSSIRVRGGRLEHVADRAAVEHALADVAEEHRQVPRTAAGRERDLSGDRGVRAHDRVDVLGEGQELGVGLQQTIQHLGDVVVGVVQDLAHTLPPRRGKRTDIQLKTTSTGFDPPTNRGSIGVRNGTPLPFIT
jgi:hypothetical protein